jgi:hypothetical protein
MEFTTPCGHTVKAAPVMKKGGVTEGKWQVVIRGPKVTGVSGKKNTYSDPNKAGTYI